MREPAGASRWTRWAGRRRAGSLREVGFDGARVHAGDLDAVSTDFLHQCLAEASDCEFAGVVGGERRVAEESGDGGDVHDVPAEAALLVLARHRRYGAAGAEKHASGVGLHQCIPGVGGRVDGIAAKAKPGVVDEHVEAAGVLFDACERGGDIGFEPDVAANRCEAITELAGEILELVFAAGEAEDVHATFDERPRELKSESATGAGNDGDLILEIPNISG